MSGSKQTTFGSDDTQADVANLLALVRERFRLIEEIDRQNVEMITGLSDAVRASAETRASASLDISVTLQRLDEGLHARENEHARRIAVLGGQLDAANRDLLSLRRSIDNIESRLLQAVAEQKPDESPSSVSEVSEAIDAGAVSTTESIVILDVPNAVTALGIQRFLEGVPGISTVVARSFESGRLRFSVSTVGSSIADAARLSDGTLLLAKQDDGESRFRLNDPERFGRLR